MLDALIGKWMVCVCCFGNAFNCELSSQSNLLCIIDDYLPARTMFCQIQKKKKDTPITSPCCNRNGRTNGRVDEKKSRCNAMMAKSKGRINQSCNLTWLQPRMMDKAKKATKHADCLARSFGSVVDFHFRDYRSKVPSSLLLVYVSC